MYLILALLGLCFCMWTIFSCGEWGYSLVACVGFLLHWFLLLQKAGSRMHRLQQSQCRT